MVRAADHQYALVLADAIDSVEKERSDLRRDEGIEVLKDEVARSAGPSQFEDEVDAILGAVKGGERFHIERRDGRTQRVESMRSGFDADCLPISWWTVEDDSTLPRNTQAMVGLACFVAEEIGGDVPEIVFQGGRENESSQRDFWMAR